MRDVTNEIFELRREKERLLKIVKNWKREIKEHQKEIACFEKDLIGLNGKIEKINQKITLREKGVGK